MHIILIGGGGREHAIAWKLAQSERVKKITCIPGNGGISQMAKIVCVPEIKATQIDKIVEYAIREQPDLVFVAPDDPLSLGLVDRLEKVGIKAFGPRQNAAIIESSKAFSKKFMKDNSIPTAKYEIFTDSQKANDYIELMGAPIVVKADGVALGKGAIVCETIEEAHRAVDDMMIKKVFGSSGETIVIEEFMTGPEITVLAFSDGKTVVPMLSSQDHKRAYDNDEGLNTGGMGAITPAPTSIYSEETAKVCMETIFEPTIRIMAEMGRPLKGIIYYGLMLTPKGPKVIEYNARFGDPETQPMLMMLETDLLKIVEAIMDERLDEIDIKWKTGAAACVVAASGGYPLAYGKGFPIKGIDDAETTASDGSVIVFHAGTTFDPKSNDFLTAGGRVLGITATGKDINEALNKAYTAIEKISFEKMYFRTDIGASAR
jgi:phosphoribosylamine--glycine ligase